MPFPRPARAALLAAILLSVTLLAPPARAEMTEADKAGMQAFTACLEETGGDEMGCIEKLGRFAWYPRDDATCEAVASRVDEILTVDGDPIWKDIFQIERCARLGLTFSTLALPEKSIGELRTLTVNCRKAKPASRCYDMYGRHLWNPVGATLLCEMVSGGLIKYSASIQTVWWDSWFRNERCHRLGLSYYDVAAGIVRKAPIEIVQ